ncbi:M43 family zinc metalloprotease [Spirosoma profusum]|nr:M43 family zinc metalloprotease [Spirosoma profusum]
MHMIKRGNNSLTNWKRTGLLAGSFLCLLSSITWGQTISANSPEEELPNRCATVVREQFLQQQNPNRLRLLNKLNRQLQAMEDAPSLRQQATDTIFRIPVVVHVVHSNASGTIGGSNNVNISDEQIRSQIQVLNEDYRRKVGTNGYNTSPIGADAGIEFFLATTDPNGQPATGITRHYYQQKSSFDVFSDAELLSQIAYWPSDRYLNIWVTSVQSYLGYTQFPIAADTLQGLIDPQYANERTDGSIIDYRYFGKQTGTVTSSLYALGRTATHEIGHWLGLFHVNGDGSCGDDHVADTTPTDNLNQTRFCNDIFSTCSGQRLRTPIENYLMYSPDACMNMFTAGQVARMRRVLTLSPARARLIKSVSAPLAETETLTINVYPNPSSADPTVDVQLKGSQSFMVDLFDLNGRQLRSTSYTNSPSTRVALAVNGLSKGLYIVRVKTDNEVASKRLLVP